jgi:hypothetical protein
MKTIFCTVSAFHKQMQQTLFSFKGWKKLISGYGRLHNIKNDIVDRLKSEKKNHENKIGYFLTRSGK